MRFISSFRCLKRSLQFNDRIMKNENTYVIRLIFANETISMEYIILFGRMDIGC